MYQALPHDNDLTKGLISEDDKQVPPPLPPRPNVRFSIIEEEKANDDIGDSFSPDHMDQFVMSLGGTHHQKVMSSASLHGKSSLVRSSRGGSQGSMRGSRSLNKKSLTTGKISGLRNSYLGDRSIGSTLSEHTITSQLKDSSAWTKSWLSQSIHGKNFSDMSNAQGPGVTVETVDFGDEETYPFTGDEVRVYVHKAYCNNATLGVSMMDCR